MCGSSGFVSCLQSYAPVLRHLHRDAHIKLYHCALVRRKQRLTRGNIRVSEMAFKVLVTVTGRHSLLKIIGRSPVKKKTRFPGKDQQTKRVGLIYKYIVLYSRGSPDNQNCCAKASSCLICSPLRALSIVVFTRIMFFFHCSPLQKKLLRKL